MLLCRSRSAACWTSIVGEFPHLRMYWSLSLSCGGDTAAFGPSRNDSGGEEKAEYVNQIFANAAHIVSTGRPPSPKTVAAHPFRSAPANGKASTPPTAQRRRNYSMPFKHSVPGLTLLACTAALGLSGCVAAPLAQMAVSQMSAPRSPCVAGPSCSSSTAASPFGDMAKGFTDSFGKLTGMSGDQMTAVAAAPQAR